MTTKYIIDNLDGSLTEQVIYGGLSADTFSATTLYVDGSQITKPYKVYTALLTQSGTDVPVANVLENTIGDIVWTRDNTGVYVATLNGAFITSKTYITTYLNGNTGNANYTQTQYIDEDLFYLYSLDSTYTTIDADDIMGIEIRVYN